MIVTWVSWESRGRDPYSNPKAKTAHAAINTSNNQVRVGSFPLACGRWAPDGFDADVFQSTATRHCRRCEAAVAKRKKEELTSSQEGC